MNLQKVQIMYKNIMKVHIMQLCIYFKILLKQNKQLSVSHSCKVFNFPNTISVLCLYTDIYVQSTSTFGLVLP